MSSSDRVDAHNTSFQGPTQFSQLEHDRQPQMAAASAGVVGKAPQPSSPAFKKVSGSSHLRSDSQLGITEPMDFATKAKAERDKTFLPLARLLEYARLCLRQLNLEECQAKRKRHDSAMALLEKVKAIEASTDTSNELISAYEEYWPEVQRLARLFVIRNLVQLYTIETGCKVFGLTHQELVKVTYDIHRFAEANMSRPFAFLHFSGSHKLYIHHCTLGKAVRTIFGQQEDPHYISRKTLEGYLYFGILYDLNPEAGPPYACGPYSIAPILPGAGHKHLDTCSTLCIHSHSGLVRHEKSSAV